MNEYYLFRFDAGDEHGLGHYSRCLAIAHSLQEKKPGARIAIFSSDTAFMREKASQVPFDLFLEKDPGEKELLAWVAKNEPDILFFDKLQALDSAVLGRLKEKTRVILFQNYFPSAGEADAVIIPGAHVAESRLPFAGSAHTTAAIYMGAEYMVINELVHPLRGRFTPGDEVRSVAITTGGSDPQGVMHSLLDAIDFDAFPTVSFNFHVGENMKHKSSLAARNTAPNINFVPFNIKELAAADLAIATFGVSTYELLYLGIPLISVAHAPSNAIGSSYLSRGCDCFADLGLIDTVSAASLNQTLSSLINSARKRKQYHERGLQLIDGKGAGRVSDIIINMSS